MTISDRKLEPGTRLFAKYKGEEHTAEVIAGKEGHSRYRLADGWVFRSPSSAGKAVMGGKACNGWRFWTVAGAKPVKATVAGGGLPPARPTSRDVPRTGSAGPQRPSRGGKPPPPRGQRAKRPNVPLPPWPSAGKRRARPPSAQSSPGSADPHCHMADPSRRPAAPALVASPDRTRSRHRVQPSEPPRIRPALVEATDDTGPSRTHAPPRRTSPQEILRGLGLAPRAFPGASGGRRAPESRDRGRETGPV